MTPDQVRTLAALLMSQVDTLGQQVDTMGKKIQRIEAVNEQLPHEIALLKRHKFAKRSKQLSLALGRLLKDLIDTNIVSNLLHRPISS